MTAAEAFGRVLDKEALGYIVRYFGLGEWAGKEFTGAHFEMFGANSPHEILGCYSNRSSVKIDQMTTIAAALKRMDAGQIKPRPPQPMRKTQRYRLADRFTPEELAQLVARYQAGEMSTSLARVKCIAKSTFLRLLAEHGVASRPRGPTPAKEKEILRLRRQGEIAKRVGCSYDVARLFLLGQK